MKYMYTDEQNRLLERMERFQKENSYSQNEAAKIVGITGTVLSQLRSGKYPNPQRPFDIIQKYFEVKDRARFTYNEAGYVPTSISTQIYNIIGVCQVKGGLAVIAGDAGIGKTKAAQKFIADNPTNSFLITVNPCLTNIKSLLKTVAEKTGASLERSVDELWNSIARRLSDGMVLIFDEAQHFTLKDIEVLRSFSDYFTDKGQTLGICFIGNTETVARIGSKKAEFAQIANRTKQQKLYTRNQIKRDDIAKLFPILREDGMEAEIDFLYKIAQTPQGIRGVVNLFSNAYDNKDYSYRGLVSMAKYMDITV